MNEDGWCIKVNEVRLKVTEARQKCIKVYEGELSYIKGYES